MSFTDEVASRQARKGRNGREQALWESGNWLVASKTATIYEVDKRGRRHAVDIVRGVTFVEARSPLVMQNEGCWELLELGESVRACARRLQKGATTTGPGETRITNCPARTHRIGYLPAPTPASARPWRI